MTNNQQLKKLMSKHGLKRRDVTERLPDVSMQAVDSWLAKPGAVGYRNMPTVCLELLKLKLV